MIAQLERIGRLFLPLRLRRFLRTTHCNFVFSRAMKRFLADPAACAYPNHPVLQDLIYGWWNLSWSSLNEYMAGCIDHALNTRGPILECGSGLSTIVLGAIAKKRGISHWALEHSPAWAKRVNKYLKKYELDSVILSTKTLKEYGDYSWYDPPLESMPDRFSLVICDGPPSTTKGGRYGLLPIMRKRLGPSCVILLDDAFRKQELAISKKWVEKIDATMEIMGTEKPYIKIVVRERPAA